MKLKLNIELMIYVLIFSILNFISIYLFVKKDLILTPSLLLAFSLAVVFIIIQRLKILTNALNNLFASIKFSDDNLKFGLEKKGRDFKKLSHTLENLKSDFILEKIEKEKNIQFLNTIVNELNSGVLVVSDEFKIIYKNKYFDKIIDNKKFLSKDNSSLINLLILNNNNGSFKENIPVNGKVLKHTILIKQIIIDNKTYKIVILENIEKQNNETQQKAWENIIRVLTHEIMNSMTPINSLAQTTKTIISQELNDSDILDIHESLNTIITRSNGLKEFIDSYRNLTLLPEPKFGKIKVNELFNNTLNLLKHDIKSKNINFEISCEKDNLSIYADESMIQQVLVNLLINAIDAVKNTYIKNIKMIAGKDHKMSTYFKIIDTGYGIEKENLENVFNPFFTTKKKGSGIGLNLCKQIMQAHHGFITVESEVSKGITFTLTF